MPKRPDFFKLGLFVVAAAVIAVGAVLVLSAGKLFRKHIDAETYVDESVLTLEVGSPVRFRGVEVGLVREITFVRTMLPREHPDFIRYGRYVLIRMSLFADVFEDLTSSDTDAVLRRLIQDGLRVRLASRGLTGQAHLEVDYVDTAANPPLAISWEPQAYYIPSAPSVMTRLTQSAERVFAQFEEADIAEIAANLDRFLVVSTQTVQEARVALLSESVIGLVGDLSETNGRLQELLAGPALGGVVSELSAAASGARGVVDHAESELAAVLADLRATSQSLRGSVESGLAPGLTELGRASPAMRETIAELPRTLSGLSSALRRVERLIAGGQGDVDVLLENLRIASENVRELSESVKRYPAQALFGGPPRPAGPPGEGGR